VLSTGGYWLVYACGKPIVGGFVCTCVGEILAGFSVFELIDRDPGSELCVFSVWILMILDLFV
jgi:hypothetical protein